MYREFNDLAECGKLSITQQAERMQVFNTQLERATIEGLVVCMGDFNINLEKYLSPTFYLRAVADEYQKTISNCGLSLIDFGITWRREHKDGSVHESAIDHGLINKPVHLIEATKKEVDYSDHSLIMMEVQCGIPRNHKSQTIHARDLRKIRANPEYLQYALSNIDWTKLAQMEEVNKMVQYWDDEICKVLDKVAPMTERKVKSKQKYELSKETYQQMRIRDEMLKSRKQLSHNRTHIGENQHSFKDCEKTLATHTGDKPYSCTECEKTLKTHTGEKHYSCTECEKTMKTHTGEKHYSCTECKKTLKTHTGEKPYSCQNYEKINALVEEKQAEYRKQRNLCNNLIKRDIRRQQGQDIRKSSSNTQIWRALSGILKAERMAFN